MNQDQMLNRIFKVEMILRDLARRLGGEEGEAAHCGAEMLEDVHDELRRNHEPS